MDKAFSALLTVLGISLAIGVLVGAYSFVQGTLLISDDFHRGEKMGEVFKQASPIDTAADSISEVRELCRETARVLYAHYLDGSGEDNPPRGEKAFYVGCSGFSYAGIQGRFDD